ncbi:hypothetical protein MLD38_004276 [Melastoma candidum]|uniref:Uncharacterized protein n=1 Tax=Melastoma candidum TaxID=119954 RepID=A0ACB9S580_9MYRT|nr:hypothetical protein MLD38_004276 [Melastoma candidum]
MSPAPAPTFILLVLFVATAASAAVIPSSSSSSSSEDPTPAPWPLQFHSVLMMNNSGKTLEMIDLWYDWTNGRNFNIIRGQLSSSLLYDLEWDNGTSFVYTLDDSKSCRVLLLGVGILRPDWLDGAEYLGQRHVNGFLCNLWTKADFIWYYEDVLTKRPVLWVFYTGREAHVMTFEVGAALEDAKWQAPVYCFGEDGRDRDDSTVVVDADNLSGLSMGMIRVGSGGGGMSLSQL